jgi:hypothetical protein
VIIQAVNKKYDHGTQEEGVKKGTQSKPVGRN